jgi:hypothetical protein
MMMKIDIQEFRNFYGLIISKYIVVYGLETCSFTLSIKHIERVKNWALNRNSSRCFQVFTRIIFLFSSGCIPILGHGTNISPLSPLQVTALCDTKRSSFQPQRNTIQ